MESKRGRHINVPVKGKSRRNTFNFEKYTLYFPSKKYYKFILCNTDNTQMVSSMTFSTCIVLQACTFTKWLFIIVKS